MRRFLPLLLLPLAVPAAAQAVSALKGHDTSAPVDIDADRVEVQQRADRAVFSGNVHAVQGNLKLDAERLRVAYLTQPGSGNPQIQRIDADGGVTMTSPSERASGRYGIYDVNRRVITLIGGVTLTRGDSVAHGGRLVMDLDSGRSTLDGGAVGGAGGSSGRVSGRFTVPQRSN
jgi:lipopolysaccharide export system protein LptA